MEELLLTDAADREPIIAIATATPEFPIVVCVGTLCLSISTAECISFPPVTFVGGIEGTVLVTTAILWIVFYTIVSVVVGNLPAGGADVARWQARVRNSCNASRRDSSEVIPRSGFVSGVAIA